MKTRFYLDKPQKSGNACVLLYVSNNGNRIKLSTKESVQIDLWDAKKERLKRSASGALEINRRLEILEERVQKICRDARDIHKVEPTGAYIKEQLMADEIPPAPKEATTFIQHFENYITTSKATKKPGTIRSYNTTLSHVKGFEKTNGIKLSFEMMDARFYQNFLLYLFNTVGLNSNTAGKVIKILKTFLRYATETEINTNMKFTKFKVLTEEVVTVSLTADELKAIEELDFSKNERLHRARNLFLLECYTGLRYSDIQKLKPENVKGSSLVLQTIKTKDNLPIPLSRNAHKIVMEYVANGMQPISIQRMNEYIKEIAVLANIDEPIQIVTHKGTERVERTVPKHELISTHTGRRTFVTLSLERGMRPEIVMRITGHKDPKSFKKYVRLTEKVTEQELLRAWDTQPDAMALAS